MRYDTSHPNWGFCPRIKRIKEVSRHYHVIRHQVAKVRANRHTDYHT